MNGRHFCLNKKCKIDILRNNLSEMSQKDVTYKTFKGDLRFRRYVSDVKSETDMCSYIFFQGMIIKSFFLHF